MEITREELENAFTEWDRRYRNDPEVFCNEAKRLLNETANTYGKSCAPYFISIINSQK